MIWLRKLDLNRCPVSATQQYAIMDTAFAIGVITNAIIDMCVKELRKTDMLFEVETNYYRRKKLNDLINLVIR